MQDNELDKIINDAANQHHPPYDDEAWGKMLVLLDKHMPQKKDRRKPVFFWLLFLLVGAGLFLGLWQLRQHNNVAASVAAAEDKSGTNQQNTTFSNTELVEKETNGSKEPGTVTATTNITKDPTITVNNTSGASVSSTVTSQPVVTKNKNIVLKTNSRFTVKIKKPAATEDDFTNTEKSSVQNKRNTKTTVVTPDEQADNDTAIIKTFEQPEKASNVVAQTTADVEKQKTIKSDSAATKQKEQPLVKSATKKEKSSKAFANNFAFTVSAGADMSFVDLSYPGKIKPVLGAGAAYTFSNHLRVSSGFYVSKKVYDAEPYQYKFANGTSYPNLYNINANCNVYEIPLNIYYNFKQQKKHNWFAGAGISSFLMKEEVYNYQYKSNWGTIYSYKKTISNQNKHYFSVLTLSGGYQYKLSNRILVMAEPYFKIPLGGVGDGKIKLNSTGLLFTAAIKPFIQKPKK